MLDQLCLLVSAIGILVGTRRLCSKFYLLCYPALVKNFAYYAQIMLTEIEQFPNIYSTILMHCLLFTFMGK